jgi:type I restriction enzyme S subunit
MNSWKKIQIGKAISFNPAESISKGKLAKKIPMGNLTEFQRKINSYELSAYSNGPKFRNGDTIMAKITPCLENGKTAYVDILEDNEVAFGSSEYIVLRETHQTNRLFIYYLAISPTFRKRAISCMEGTSGRKRVSEKILKYFELKFPPINIQKQIAKVLSDLDTKIEINNKINLELEAMAKTLYDYWFVQFDFPAPSASSGQAGKPYKSSGGKMVFNEELKREIPEGWEVDSFSSWIKNDKSGDWGKEIEQGNYVNKVSCIRGADLNGINGKGVVKSPTRFVLEKNCHKLLEIGDFIIEISGGSPTQSTGRMAFITQETLERFENPLICSNFCKAITLKEEKALYNFAYEWNRLYDARVLFGWEGKTSGIKNLLFESFVTNHQVVMPESKVMEQFYNKAKPIHAQIQTNLKLNQKLSELRDWLLPMLMNGQVSVGGVEQEFGMVAEDNAKYGEE